VTRDEVLVRWMNVDHVPPAVVDAWLGWLDSDEIARADRFRVDHARIAYVGAHALVRSLLAVAGPYPPEEWRFVSDDGGKPSVDPALASPVRFNLSHTRGLVAAAVCVGHDVGVDVERCDRDVGVEELARRYFTPEEVELVRGDGGRDAFFRLWTLKEAAVKATGEGLGRALGSVAFSLDPIAAHGDAPGRWQFFQARPTPDHLVAAAVRLLGGVGDRVTFDAAAVVPDDFPPQDLGSHSSHPHHDRSVSQV
jgi:4'-phosphopantetheinyl transferase